METKFDDMFGTSAAIDPFNFNNQNGMRKDDKYDLKTLCINVCEIKFNVVKSSS